MNTQNIFIVFITVLSICFDLQARPVGPLEYMSYAQDEAPNHDDYMRVGCLKVEPFLKKYPSLVRWLESGNDGSKKKNNTSCKKNFSKSNHYSEKDRT